MRCILTSLTFLSLALPTALHAQTNCADRKLVIEKLEASYGEVFAGGGLQSATQIFEVWFSDEKGTWTILMTRADGLSCIMASGTNWREGDPSLKKPAGVQG
jgi:hypothetical protein